MKYHPVSIKLFSVQVLSILLSIMIDSPQWLIKMGKFWASNEFIICSRFVICVISGHGAPHLLVSISCFCCCSSSLISLPTVCHCDCWIQSLTWNKVSETEIHLILLSIHDDTLIPLWYSLSGWYILSHREVVSYEFGNGFTVLSDGLIRAERQLDCNELICQHYDAMRM